MYVCVISYLWATAVPPTSRLPKIELPYMGFERIWYGPLDSARATVQNVFVKFSFGRFCDFLGFRILTASKIMDLSCKVMPTKLLKHDQLGQGVGTACSIDLVAICIDLRRTATP